MKCTKCGNELKDGMKFCTKCGTAVSANPQQSAVKQSPSMNVCIKCGNQLKPGQKFCTKCGASVSALQQPAQAGQKGWFTDGVRAVANAVTGGALNRDIERQQQQAIRQQVIEDQGLINDAQQVQRAAERAQRSVEEEAERARDRRNQEAIDGIDVVRGRAIWNIQPGQIARRVTESEFNEIEGLKGVIIQEGCTAVVYVDGELVGMLSGGAYTFPVKSEAEKKAEREAAENKVASEEQRQRKQETFMDRGLFGTIGIGLNTVRRFFFGNKKGESEQKQKVRKEKVDKILKSKTQVKLIRVYLVSDRVLTLTFGGQPSDAGIDFVPFNVPTKLVDVEIGVSLQMQITNINDFLCNYLADCDSVTSNAVQQMLMPAVQNLVCQMLRNLDYQQDGLPEPILNNLRNRIQQAINEQVFGIQCVRVMQITDRSADFDRFRAVERELFCAEKELGYLQRTGEFRNRLAAETNKQEIDKATNEEDLRYALQQINKDQLLHDDEMEQFILMLNAQKRLREAKSQEEVYEALIDIKKSRLVKDDEMATLEDALAQNKIQRDSVTEIMRIQHQQSVDDARLKAQWALDDQKQDHDWEREDLQRRRNWGIEDEQREREWMHEEQEYNRKWGRTQQEDEYLWQKHIREEDYEWQNQERQREAEWNQRMREEQLRRENEQTAYERQRQSKFDDADLHERRADNVIERLRKMQEMELAEQNARQDFELAKNAQNQETERARIDAETRMTQEQIAAAHMKDIAGLDVAAQSEMAKMMGSGNTVKAEMMEQQKNEMKDMYEKMMAMQQQNQNGQQQQANMTQQQMMQMMQMMMQGMTQMGAAQAAGVQQMNQQQMNFMQQRIADQKEMKNEYRQDAQRQQDRMDHAMDQSLNYTTRAHQTDSQSFAQAMGGTPQNFQQMPQQPNQQSMPTQAPVASQVRHCPVCGAEVPEDAMYCGECRNRMN